MICFFKNIFVPLVTLGVLLLSFNPAYANEEETPLPCVYNKGIFKTSSGTEFKGAGSKGKCSELERKELVEKKCSSGVGSVSDDGQGLFTVQCE